MEGMDLLRMMGALLLVLGVMVCALWLVRKLNLVPGAARGSTINRMEVVERIGIDQKRSAILLRLDDKEHLVVLSPEGLLNVATVEHSGREAKPARAKSGEKNFASMVIDAAGHAGVIRKRGGTDA